MSNNMSDNKNKFLEKYTPGVTILGISIAGISFLMAPTVAKVVKDSYKAFKEHQADMSTAEKLAALFFGVGMVVPYTTIGFYYIIRRVEKRANKNSERRT
jgi:hypothetical protein